MSLSGGVALAGVLVLGLAGRAWLGAARPVSGPPRRPRARATTPQQWAALLDTMAAEVRTGSSLAAAHAHSMGLSPWCVHTARPQADERVVLQAVHATQALGGPVAATLDSAAAMLRERLAIRAETAAHSAQARLSARVLTAVPLVFCAWNLVASASFRSASLSPAGRVCAAVGIACNIAGWWWMRRIVTKAAQ